MPKCGPPGQDGRDGKQGPPGPPGEVDVGLLAEIQAAQAEILDRLAQLEQTRPEDPDERLLLYYTTKHPSERIRRVDAAIAELKGDGWPIVITRLDPQDTKTRGVPRIYVLAQDRHIVGVSNCLSFLATLVR